MHRPDAAVVLRSSRMLLTALRAALPAAGLAQALPPLPQVSIVDLLHGHVEGFLRVLPQLRDVELVGICDPAPA
jgi:hypothetical protein